MSIRFLLLLACLLAVALAGKKSKKQKARPAYVQAPTQVKAPSVYMPIYNSGGPDNARYVYSAGPFYDHRSYKNANVQLSRFPGGVSYSHNEKGYGADVKVNFQSYPSRTYYAQGNNKG